VDYDNNSRRFESVFSKKVRAGKRRTYFFDVRQTKGEDYYLTLTESTKKFETDSYERHKIFLYKEDFNRFLDGLTEAIDYVKTELLPDYDYDEFTKRHIEWEAQRALEDAEAAKAAEGGASTEETTTTETEESDTEDITGDIDVTKDDDMSW
jgi:hypothetical protein